jgi:hypothetical protein
MPPICIRRTCSGRENDNRARSLLYALVFLTVALFDWGAVRPASRSGAAVVRARAGAAPDRRARQMRLHLFPNAC